MPLLNLDSLPRPNKHSREKTTPRAAKTKKSKSFKHTETFTEYNLKIKILSTNTLLERMQSYIINICLIFSLKVEYLAMEINFSV